MASNAYLSQVIWYNSTIGLPLATVSIILSQYNNTVLTSTTTVYGDLTSLTGTSLPQVVSAQDEIQAQFSTAVNLIDYPGLAPYALGDTTDGTDVNIPSEPTPYMAIAGIVLWTSVPGPCDQDVTTASQISCTTCYLGDTNMFMEGDDNFPGSGGPIGMTSISLTTTFYAPLTYPSNYPTAVLDRLSYFFEFIEPFPLSSFIEFISSETQLLMSLPILASCSYVPAAVGPPALKFPVSALTATVTATTIDSSLYPLGNTPTPANPIEPPIGPPTTTQPVPLPPLTNQASPNQGSPNQYSPPQESPTQGPLSPPSAAVGPVTQRVSEPSQLLQPQISNGPQVSGDSSSNQASEESLTIASSKSRGTQQQAPPGQAEAGPALSYAGTTIQPDASTQYDLPGIGKVRPGGPPVTTASVIFSLAPSRSELISNGIPVAINPVADVPEPARQPLVFTVGGNGYTADVSSNFLIEGQTLAPGSTAITLSGTPISLAAGASQAIVGSSTVVIHPAGITPAPGAGNIPALTFAGSTYSANSLGLFVIGEQTLSPGAAITVSGTQISLAAAGYAAVIGSSTELLALNGARTAALLTLHGSTFTADAASGFVISGQTLTPGGSIEVSGTPISYPAEATAVVIGTKTLPLSFGTISGAVRPIITFAGSIFTADAASDFTINGKILTPGGNIDVSGTPISYPLAGTAMVIGTSTEPFSFATITGTDTRTITFDGSTYTVDASSEFVIDGQTLAPGGVITINGTPVSYAAAETDVVIGTSTEAVGMGNLIMSGLGNGPNGSANTGMVQFTGDALSQNKPAKGAVMILFGALILAIA